MFDAQVVKVRNTAGQVVEVSWRGVCGGPRRFGQPLRLRQLSTTIQTAFMERWYGTMRGLVAPLRLGNVHDVCRQHNIAEQTLYRWRRQLGGMAVSDAKRLRALERENAAFKRLVGELTLDNRLLKDVLGKNG